MGLISSHQNFKCVVFQLYICWSICVSYACYFINQWFHISVKTGSDVALYYVVIHSGVVDFSSKHNVAHIN